METTAKRVCKFEDCDRKIAARGWCKKHYNAWLRNGTPETNARFSRPEESMKRRSVRKGSCIVWTGYVSPKGYGTIKADGKMWLVHRFAWVLENGDIPKGSQVDHTCYTRSCINVDHLRLVRPVENSQNRSGAVPGSESGIRNVKRNGRNWAVSVKKDGVSKHYGTYESLDEAAMVAERARQENFGAYAGKG